MNLDLLTDNPDWLRALRDFSTYLRLERHLSANTEEAYLRDVRFVARYASEKGKKPADVDVNDLREVIVDLNDMGIAASSQSRIVSGMRSFFQMLLLEEEIENNPAEMLEVPGSVHHLPDVLTDKEIDALIATFDLSMPDQARNRVIVEVLYGCGLRVSELVELKLSNIHTDDECLLVTGKGSKQRWVPINEYALHLVVQYISTIRVHQKIRHGEENYVFINRLGTHLSRNYVFMFLKAAVAAAGIKKNISPHSLRHSFATELVNNGADLRAVQEMLGHEHLKTTEIYTHLSRQYLRETISTYHPHYARK